MRLLLTYSLSALTFVAIAGAQIVLDPSPARVVGHPSTTPAEQLQGMAKRNKMPPEVLAYFVKMGAKGGKIGGKRRAANMTEEQRSEGARKASQARWARVKAECGDGA